LIFGMLAQIASDVRAQRGYAEMMGTREFEAGASEFRGQAISTQRLGHFGVVERDVTRKTAVGEQGALAVDGGFEALRGFVVFDGDTVEVYFHGAPTAWGELQRTERLRLA
jgi:hypothetical protein